MRLFLDVGLATWIILIVLAVTQWWLPEPYFTIVRYYNPLAIPGAFFGFYVLWHMLRSRGWGWAIASSVLAIGLFPLYYIRVVRPSLMKHDAQQGTPADPPRPAGSAGG